MRAWSLAIVVAVLVLAGPSPRSAGIPPAWAANCVYEDNLSELAISFRGRCCLGSIRERWPGQSDQATLATTRREKDAGVKAAVTACKLLNDSRFRK